MTITATESRWDYVGDGSTKAFPFSNRVFAATDLRVLLDGQRQTGGYTVSGIDAITGGQVVFGVAPAVGAVVTLIRATPAKQLTAYPSNDRFPATAHERALDKLTVVAQQLETGLSRTLRLPDLEPGGDLTLPVAQERAGRLMTFNMAGTPTASDLTVAQLEGAAQAAWLDGQSVGDVTGYVGDGVTVRFPTGHNLISKSSVTVVIGGVKQLPDAYSIDGQDVVLVAAPEAGLAVDIRVLGVNVALADASGSQIIVPGAIAPRPLVQHLGDVTNCRSIGAAADGVTDDAALLNAALARGGDVYLPDGGYLIESGLTMSVAGTRLYGPGAIKLAAGFDADEAVRIEAENCVLDGVTIDGLGAQLTAERSYSLLRAIQGVSSGLTVKRCTLQGARGAGVVVGEASEITSNVTIDRCRITETGWTGIVLFGVQGGGVKGCEIDKTGENSVAMWGACAALDISANRMSKAEAPAYVYDGPGSLGGVHTGGWIRLSPGVPDTPDDGGHQITIAKNWCYDCTTTGSDGFVMGEHDEGSEFGTHVIDGNYLIKAGGWGIDVGANMTVTNNWIIEPGADGILIGQDFGGIVRSTSVLNNTIINAPAGIVMTANLATSIEYNNIRVAGNKVIDTRAIPACLHGFRYNSSNATFTNVVVEDNNFTGAATAVSRMAGTTSPEGLIIRRNQLSTPIHAVSGASFSVVGYETFLLSNASPANLTGLIGGHIGQEVLIQFADANTTLVPNYGGTVTGGVQPFWGGSNVPLPMRANDIVRARCMGDWWAWSVVHTGSRGTLVGGLVDANSAYLTSVAEWPARITSDAASAANRGSFALLRRSTGGGATADTAFLGGLSLGGHNGATYTYGYNGGGELYAKAIGAWTETSNGTTWELTTTPYNSTTPVVHQRWTHDGLTGFPRTPNTATGGNVYMDGSGYLYRSTSSERYKRDIEAPDYDLIRQLGPELIASAIWFRSAIPTDPQSHSYWGMSAEKVAAADPRLAQWAYDPADLQEAEVDGVVRVLPRPGATPRPDGVQYAQAVMMIALYLADRLTRAGIPE